MTVFNVYKVTSYGQKPEPYDIEGTIRAVLGCSLKDQFFKAKDHPSEQAILILCSAAAATKLSEQGPEIGFAEVALDPVRTARIHQDNQRKRMTPQMPA